MTKNLILLAAFGLLGLCSSAEARPRQKGDGFIAYPRGAGAGTQAGNSNQYGAAISTEAADGTPTANSKAAYTDLKMWSRSPGLLYGISMTSGAAVTDYVICIDTDATAAGASTTLATAAGLWASADSSLIVLGICSRSATLTQFCAASGAAGSSGTAPPPIGFKDGLACQSSTARWYAPVFREDR